LWLLYGQLVVCFPEGFCHHGEPIEHTTGDQDMGGVGTLGASRLAPAEDPTEFQQLIEPHLLSVPKKYL
jgi:hypothetical protein